MMRRFNEGGLLGLYILLLEHFGEVRPAPSGTGDGFASYMGRAHAPSMPAAFSFISFDTIHKQKVPFLFFYWINFTVTFGSAFFLPIVEARF